MKNLFLIFALVFLTTSCVAQKEIEQERSIILQNALVSQVSKDITTLSYLGRTYEVDGTYVKGKKYVAALRITDCNDCPIIKGVTEYNHVSPLQVKLDIEDALRALEEAKRKDKGK